MKKTTTNLLFLLFVVLVMVLAIWGPETLALYKDHSVLNKPTIQDVETAGEGYRYILSSNEKLYILSQCLNNQVLPESEQNALARESLSDYPSEENDGAYAFVTNNRGDSTQEATENDIFSMCNQELKTLKELGILPASILEVNVSDYDKTLYSAIDVLDPRNNLAVWKLSLSNSQKNANKENRLLDIYMDADTGKIYEFYARTEWLWEDVYSDKIINAWSEYLGLSAPESYEHANPLMETTPYFKKYLFDGMGEGKTVATIGFYEGINELFLKISK